MRQINFDYILKNLLPSSTRYSDWLMQLVELLAGFLQGLYSTFHAKISDFTTFAETPALTHSVNNYLREKLGNSGIMIENYQVYTPLVLFQKAEQKNNKLYQKKEGINIYTLQLTETEQPYNFIISAMGSNTEEIEIIISDFVLSGTNYKII